MTQQELWAELHDFFETDDGSLPEFWINYSNPAALPAALSILALPPDTRSHHMLGPITWNGVQLPELGIFVADDQLAIDYRMGPEWNPANVHALLTLFAALQDLDPAATVTLEDYAAPSAETRFQQIWKDFLKERT